MGGEWHEGELVRGVCADAEEGNTAHATAQREAENLRKELDSLINIANSQGNVAQLHWRAGKNLGLSHGVYLAGAIVARDPERARYAVA